MRLNYALFVLLFTTGFAAQEEPLPLVSPRTTPAPDVMLIATAVEPIRDFPTPTLAEAARNNDWASFDQLYREARKRGEGAQFQTLHELWTYNVTDPIGAFYGTDMYERLSRAYPGYAAFIDQYRIVDSNGNVFYPTSETRAFVLERAMEGRSAPRVLVAAAEPPVARAPVAKPHRAKATVAQAPKPKPAPVVVAEAPAPVPVAASAPVAASPAPEAAQPAQPAPSPVVTTPAPIATPAPAVAATTEPAKAATNRGLLLIVIGLLGVGLLAVMFKTPQETLPPIINVKPAKEEPPVTPVEPLRRPEGSPRAGKNRASGSHG